MIYLALEENFILSAKTRKYPQLLSKTSKLFLQKIKMDEK